MFQAPIVELITEILDESLTRGDLETFGLSDLIQTLKQREPLNASQTLARRGSDILNEVVLLVFKLERPIL